MTTEEEDARVRQFTGLAKKLASNFLATHSMTRFDDVYSDALVGIMTALRTHRPTRATLKTWIGNNIVYAMLDGERRRDWLKRYQRADMESGAVPKMHRHSAEDVIGYDDHGVPITRRDLLPSRESAVEHRLLQVEEAEKVLGFLNPYESEVLRMRYLECLGHEEGAARLGISMGAYHVRHHSAIHRLRQKLGVEAS